MLVNVFLNAIVILPDTIAEMRVSGNEWVLANTNVSGYFRVNYDEGNWDRLLSLLNTSHLVGSILFALNTKGPDALLFG